MLCTLPWAIPVERAAALDLSLRAPHGCPRQAELEARVLALLSQKGRADLGVRAQAEITRLDSGQFRLALRVVVGGQELSRVVEGGTCSSVCDAAAWLIAMTAPGAKVDGAKRGPVMAPRTPKIGKATQAAQGIANGADAGGESGTGASASGPDAGGQGSAGPSGATAAGTTAIPASPASARASSSAAGHAAAVAPAAASLQAPPAAAPVSPAGEPKQRTSSSAASARTDGRRDRHASTRPPRSAWGRVNAFAGYFDAGLPHGAASVGITAGYGRGGFYGQLRGVFAVPTLDELPDSGKVRVRTGQLSLVGCYLWGERLRGGPCLELRGARSVIEVIEVSKPGEQDVHWLSGGPSAQLGYRVWRRWELVLEAGLGLPLTGRPRVSVTGRGEVLRASFVSGFANLGVGARWP